ncbi:NAD(P)/FAD-dependent oxidoreductase [Paenibacillus terrae]|uniref:FAD-dependent pyridine nucleotide-disulfide oxidoreductase n=1 Tax=Paenibacillus terrae (strain HPL-003) TaxID=985665 RepID=G7W2U9_PAETH|nr:NAD(P)/FAD-dependent oxidoreductase [Paenibacillus terrae]AET60605.1 FAD-dependent pyridine nucleotide-disulfide oxidoreductase [Paenibacillus terrae HPL-003]
MNQLDCIIVGAGPAGIGMGNVLQDLGVTEFVILERGEVGSSFLLWQKEMRLLTPSFTGNAYGMLDLNAVTMNTSPAYTLGTEHPSGREYAAYLQAVATFKELPIETGIDVISVRKTASGFQVETSKGTKLAKHVIWAGGEFQYPRLDGFPGADLCLHTSLIQDWTQVESGEVVIIGGYESGADAAIHLARLGKKVQVIDRNGRWHVKGSSDPSVELSPYTKDRLRDISSTGHATFVNGYTVYRVEAAGDNLYDVYCEDADGNTMMLQTGHAPILASGFKGSITLIEDLFEKDEQGRVLLNTKDESTITPGLFLVGPGVAHGNLLFCFIYKFRQRFAVVGQVIGNNLSLEMPMLDTYRKEGLLLDDLSCCGEECKC